MLAANKIQTIIQQGLNLYSAGRVAEAKGIFLNLQKQGVMFPALYTILAGCERRLGNLHSSENYYKKALKKDSSNPDCHNGYGLLLKAKGDLTGAIASFKQVLKLNSQSVDGQLNLAHSYRQTNQYQQALPHLQALAKLYPDSAKVVLPYLDTLLLLGELESLNRAFDDHQQGFSHYTEAQLIQLCQIFRKCGDYKNAVYWIEQGLERFSTSLELQRLKAICLQLTGNSLAAQQQLQDCLTVSSQDEQTHALLSDFLWLNGDQDNFKYYKSTLQHHPHNEALYVPMIVKMIKMDRLEEAKEQTLKLLHINPDNPYGHGFMGYILRETGNAVQGIDAYRKASKLLPENKDFIKELAVAHMVTEDYSLARSLIDKLIKTSPEQQGWWACKATLLKLTGNMDEYRQLYNYDSFVRPVAIDEYCSGNRLQQLKDSLYQLHNTQNHPIEQSLRHGTQTMDNLFDLPIEEVQHLKGGISNALKDYIAGLPDGKRHPFLQRKSKGFRYQGSWSVKLSESGFHRNHYHHQGWISAPFYISTPGMDNSDGQGWLKFGQPELSRYLSMEPDYIVRPEAGYVVFFPSYMWHGTVPFSGNKERMTVAFDVAPAES